MGSTPNSSRFPGAHQTLAEVHALALAEVATTAAAAKAGARCQRHTDPLIRRLGRPAV
jgi:hypothetical protein